MEHLIINIATLIGAITTILGAISYLLKKQFEPLNQKMDNKDYNDCKKYLTDFLTDLENGIPKSEIQKQMASETYDHYITPKESGGLGGNSWVKNKWENLIK